MYYSIKHMLNYDDVLIVPEVNEHENYESRSQVSLTRKKSKFAGYIPIIASNMSTIGTFNVARTLSRYGMITALHKFYTLDDYKKEFEPNMIVMVSCGMKKDNYNNMREILEFFPEIKFINLDVANGYIKKFAFFVEEVKKQYSDKVVIAGNVATVDGVKRLVDFGADVVKVGIGNGSVCMTRHMTGVGIPQLSAVIECSEYGEIIADGGFKYPGDIAKAFCAGAEAVMVGSLFANTNESGNMYYGMSSTYAQKKFNMYGEYKASEGTVIEFKEERVPLEEVVKNILGGLRSTLSYCNCMTLDDFVGKRNFVVANNIYNDKWAKTKSNFL